MNIKAKISQFFKIPIRGGNQGFALMLTVLFMVIVSFFISRNFDMISNNMKNAQNLRAQSFLGKQAVSAVGMAKKIFTPPWKIPCGMVGGDRAKQRWACPVLFPDPFICADDPAVIKPMMSEGSKDYWKWIESPVPHLKLRMPFFASGLKEEKWKSILQNGYKNSNFSTSLVIPGQLRCKKNSSGEIIQNYLDIKTLAKYKKDEYAQRAVFPLTPPPPKCFLSASPSSFKNVLDSSSVNKPFYDWPWGYGVAQKEIEVRECLPSGKCKNVKHTVNRPPYFEQYEPPLITLTAEAYGIFEYGGLSSSSGGLDKNTNYSLNKGKKIVEKVPTPQSAPCSRVAEYSYTLAYPSWLVHYLSTPVSKLPRWAREFASKKEETCTASVRFSFDSRISVAKCGSPSAPPRPKPNDDSQLTPIQSISGVTEDFGNGLSIGYDNDGNISVTDSAEP